MDAEGGKEYERLTDVGAVPDISDRPLGPSGRPMRRNRRLPLRFQDILPTPPPSMPLSRPDDRRGTEAADTLIRRVILNVRDKVRTATSRFGVFREFYDRPSADPDGDLTLEELAGLSGPTDQDRHASSDNHDPGSRSTSGSNPWYYPFANVLQYLASAWWLQTPSGQRSDPDFDSLVRNVMLDARFCPGDLEGFNSHKMKRLMDNLGQNDEGPQLPGEGWKKNVGVSIQVPEGLKQGATAEGRTFEVPGLFHRSITGIIRSVFATATNLHFTPFTTFWKDPSLPDGPAQRVYGELYASAAFHDAHAEIQGPKYKTPDCNLEKVVAGLMFWSDSTHLAQFGTAKLWPIYLFFGNMSKLWRGKPNSNLSEHLAYIPSVCTSPQ